MISREDVSRLLAVNHSVASFMVLIFLCDIFFFNKVYIQAYTLLNDKCKQSSMCDKVLIKPVIDRTDNFVSVRMNSSKNVNLLPK